MQNTHIEDKPQTISQEIMQYLEGLSGDALKSKDAAGIERALLDSLLHIGKLSLSHVLAQRQEEIEQLPVKAIGREKLTNKGVENRMYQFLNTLNDQPEINPIKSIPPNYSTPCCKSQSKSVLLPLAR
jgi:hypothetical protein